MPPKFTPIPLAAFFSIPYHLKNLLLIACLWLCIIITFIGSAADAAPLRFFAPATNVNSAFQVFDTGLVNLTGLFPQGTASFSLDEDKQILSNLNISISILRPILPNDSDSTALAEYLHANISPELSFFAPKVKYSDKQAFNLAGTLTLNGLSKPVVFIASLNRLSVRRAEAAGLSLRTTLSGSDFNLGNQDTATANEAITANDGSSARFGNKITLIIDIKAIGE